MQRLSGLLMVFAGVGLGGYMMLPSSTDNAETLAEVTRIATSSGTGAIAAQSNGASHLNLPKIVLEGATAETADAHDAHDTSVRVFSPKTPLLQPDPADVPAVTSKWTAVVTTEPTGAAKLTSPKPGDADARAHLTSDLQRELKRVGCYGGEINGAWTQTTKRAMSAFMDRVNASLPIEDPDYILLSLVQGHAAVACGTDCPAGEVQSESGRCLPHAVVAQASRKMQRYEDRREERRLAELRKAQQQERLAQVQREADAKRIADVQHLPRGVAQREQAQRLQAQRLAAAATAEADALDLQSAEPKPRQTAAAAPEVLPWLNDGIVSGQQPRAAASDGRPEPLPGRMAVGGPVAARQDLPAATGLTATDPMPRIGIARDRTDADNLRSAPAPLRQAALQGLSGTKAGPAAEAIGLDGAAIEPAFRKYPPAKIIRRPPPGGFYAPKTYGAKHASKHKSKRYAYNSGGKTRRGQPRPGTPRYNLLQSLGGIY